MNKGIAEANIVKQRMGEVGPVLLTFQGEYSKFSSFAGQYQRNEPKKQPRGFDDEGLTIGIVREHFVEGLDAEIASAVREAVQVYQSLGAKVRDVSLPHSQ